MGAIEDVDIKRCIADSVSETFRTQRSIEPALMEEEPPAASGVHRMAGAVHFAGQVSGIFNIQLTADFGRILAAGMRETAFEAVDRDAAVRDFVGEITAIIGGRLKSALNEAGLACVICSPTVTSGTDFTLNFRNMGRFERCVFRKDDHILIAEVALKAAGGRQTDFDLSAPDALSRIPNVDRSNLDALDYPGEVCGAVIDAFKSIGSINLEAAPPASGGSLTGMREVSSVCLGGDAVATVSIGVDREWSRRLAARRLGRQPEEIEGREAVTDVLGQVVSAAGGRLKSALAGIGLRCALSDPCFTSGSNFTIETLNLERCEQVAFQTQGHRILVDWGVSISEPAKPAPAAGPDTRKPKADPGARKTQAGAETAPAPDDFGLEILLDIPVELTVELGRTRMPIHELLKLQPGSAVKLSRLEGEPVDILASDVLIARGEVVVRNEKYGIRITEITSRLDRLKGFK